MLLATACGDDPPVTPPPTNPAKIISFTADRTSVTAGSMVTLSWRVENATSVKISSPAEVLVPDSSELTGTVVTTVNAQTTFTILATGAGGNATNSVTVNIAAANEVQITSFSANPTTVAPGESVTLQWTTANATSIELTAVGNATPIVASSTTRLTSDENVQPQVTTTYVLTAMGAGGTMTTQDVTVVVEGTPVITTFSATPQAIELGEMATLSWTVTGAMTIRIEDAAGNEVFTGTMGTGTQAVTPTETTTYTLIATSARNQVVRSADVTVTVNRAAIVTSFTANPSTVDYGDPSELRWVVERAPGGITITTADGTVVHTSSAAMGGFTVTPTITTSYTLTAINPNGDTTAGTAVTVNPAAPRIAAFTASPNPARITEQARLAWVTSGATSVRVLDGAGTAIYTGTDASGSVDVTVTSTLAIYTLETTNPNGGNTQTVTLVGQFDPIITTLTVVPTYFIGSSTTATVTWAATDATSTSLTINGVPAVGFPGTATGTFTFTTTTTARVVLTAINDIGSATREVLVGRLIDGTVDTGRTASTAIALGNTPGAVGVISPPGGPAGDLDYYSVVVPEGGNIAIELTDGRGGCPFDSYVSLFGPDGTTLLGFDDDTGIDVCSSITPARNAFAVNLAAGTYYIQVRGFNNTASGTTVDYGRYVLSVTVNPPVCGNGFTEFRAAEQCDDTNLVSGDGCSAACTVEPVATVMGPGVSQTVGGALTPVGNADYIRVDMQAPGYIAAEVFIPTRGRCDAATGSADPLLTLYDANFVALGSDNDDGIASCARIDPTVDAFSLVQAGTYYLRVTESGNDAAIAAYVVDVRTLGQGCGNAVLEGAEECDDGNNAEGDGCNLTCEFEGLRETEPNNTFATGNVIVTATSSFIVRGAIATAGDFDFFLIDVPAGYHVDAYATVNSLTDCPETPEATVGLYGTTGTLLGSTNSTGGPQGNCGRVWPYTVTQSRALAVGRYGIRVAATSGTIGTYFLHVNIIAPGCGNTIREGTEQCDDGNGATGDGCSDTCTFEPVATVDLSQLTTTTVTGSINPEFNRDAIRLTVTTTTVYLRAETFVDAAARTCPAITTRLRLFSDAGVELGFDTTDGVNSCSLIHPELDAFATLLPGNYWLVVEEEGNNAIIPNYSVVVSGLARNVCGNGIVETDRGEQCDGQSFCDANCDIVPVAVLTGPTGDMTYTNALAIGEFDFYRLDVSAESYVTFETGVPTVGTCAAGNDTVVTLFDAVTGDVIDSNDDIVSGSNLCSRLSLADNVRVDAGSYFVVVEEYQNNAAIAAYQVQLRIIAVDVCGNGVVETGETCDDANTGSGDGCSAICAVEPIGSFTGPGTPAVTFNDAITPVGQIDTFEIVVTAASYLRAETFAPTVGTCTAVNTVLRLRNAAGTQLGTDDDDGIDSCSLITQADTFSRLAPGTYTLSVEESGNNAAIAAYALTVNLIPVDVCGNGAVETGETCDDGNTTAGDGCSAVCAFEPVGTYTGPGPAVTFNDAISVIGQLDRFTIVVTQTSFLRAETFAPTAGVCNGGVDTVIRLRNAAGTEVGSDDEDGLSSCSLIAPSDAFARLAPGTYTLSVEEYSSPAGGNATIPAYALTVQLFAINSCGNTVTEAGEQCDDGNTAGGDGCSATCQLEIPVVAETEPNSTPQTAQVLGPVNGATSFLVQAAVPTLGDVDFYRFTLTAPAQVQIATHTNASNIGVCAGIDTQLYLYNAIPTNITANTVANEPTLVEYDDDDNGACSRISGTVTTPTRRTLQAGTYYVQARMYNNNSTGNYFVTFDFIP